MAKTKVILHIGLPKTGTKSLQRYLLDHVRMLRRQGFDLWISDIFRNRAHTELHLSALRDGVETFSTLKYPTWNRAKLHATTRESIEHFVRHSKASRLIFTSEGLSFLRTTEEVHRVRDLFPSDVSFQVILVLRDKDDWLRSYTQQILKRPERAPSQDPNSALYVEPDTWLTNFDQIIEAYSAVFGPITVLHYDKNRSVEDVLEAMGIEADGSAADYRFNVTGAANPSLGLLGALRRKLGLRR